MCDAEWLDDGQDDEAADVVARAVFAVWLLQTDVKIGEVARPGSQGGCEARKEGRPRWRIVDRKARGSGAVGTHLYRYIAPSLVQQQ